MIARLRDRARELTARRRAPPEPITDAIARAWTTPPAYRYTQPPRPGHPLRIRLLERALLCSMGLHGRVGDRAVNLPALHGPVDNRAVNLRR